MGQIRAFIAVKLSEGTVRELSRLIDMLKKTDDDIKWVKPENMHLTLKFLGNIEENSVYKISEELNMIAQRCQPFDIDINVIGSFPDWRKPRVIWAGIEPGLCVLEEIAYCVEKAMTDLGLEKERRQFKPHITLGRVINIKDKRKFRQKVSSIKIDPVITHVSEIILFSSVLTPDGAVYTKLSSFKFI